MKRYVLEIMDLRGLIQEIDSKLNKISVNGESVENLYVSRIILKEIFNSIKTEEEIKEKEEIK